MVVGVACHRQVSEEALCSMIYFSIRAMLHVEGQEKPSLAAHTQETWTDVDCKKSPHTFVQGVPAVIRKAW
jgi:hypothetical protein